MDIAESVRRLAAEFDALLAETQKNVARTADEERSASLASLDEAQDLLQSAEQAHRALDEAVANYHQFERQLVQMEQIYLISEDLKNVVRGLEHAHKQQ